MSTSSRASASSAPEGVAHPAPAAGAEDGPRIRLTPAALETVRELLREEDLLDDGGLRLSARFGAGCSTPLRFGLELDTRAREGEIVLRGGGIRLFVSRRDAWSLDGLEVDWVDAPGMGEGFAFRHPRRRGGRC